LCHQPIHFFSKLLGRCSQSRAPRIDHYIPLGADFGKPNAERFPKASLNPVPADCFSKGARNRKTHPRPFAFLTLDVQAKRRKVRAVNSFPLVIRFAEIRSS